MQNEASGTVMGESESRLGFKSRIRRFFGNDLTNFGIDSA